MWCEKMEFCLVFMTDHCPRILFRWSYQPPLLILGLRAEGCGITDSLIVIIRVPAIPPETFWAECIPGTPTSQSNGWALHKKSATATLDLKSAIANRQVRNKDVQYPQQLLWLIAHGC